MFPAVKSVSNAITKKNILKGCKSLCFSKTRDMVNPMNLETNIQTTKINHISIFNYHENTTYGFVENKLTTLIIDSTVQFLLLYIHPVLFVIFTILLAIKNTIMPIQILEYYQVLEKKNILVVF